LRRGEREGVEWVVREGVGAGGRNYARMNNKRKMKKKKLLRSMLLNAT
jgi:hypothetical protein